MTAKALLEKTGLSILDAARITLELFELCSEQNDMATLKKVIQLGAEQLRRENDSVTFAHAMQFTIDAKKHRSARTVQDIRQTLSTLIKHQPKLQDKAIRAITTSDCLQILRKAYAHSPSRFIKARANLSGLFNLSIKQGWCADNPVRGVPIPALRERVIEALPLPQIKTLLQTAQQKKHRDCLAPLALMLYAGVRPDEVPRLQWEDIDWEDKVLYLHARHSKTGGGRHIPLSPVLLNLLRPQRKEGSFCPPAWRKRWQYLRQAAGFDNWVPDVLRHSFASYHAKHFQDLPKLQLAMGHRDCQLLLTRYINLRGISKSDALQFWRGTYLSTKCTHKN